MPAADHNADARHFRGKPAVEIGMNQVSMNQIGAYLAGDPAQTQWQAQVIIAVDHEAANGNVTLARLPQHVVHRPLFFDQDDEMRIHIGSAQALQQEQQMALGAADSRDLDDVGDAHRQALTPWSRVRPF